MARKEPISVPATPSARRQRRTTSYRSKKSRSTTQSERLLTYSLPHRAKWSSKKQLKKAILYLRNFSLSSFGTFSGFRLPTRQWRMAVAEFFLPKKTSSDTVVVYQHSSTFFRLKVVGSLLTIAISVSVIGASSWQFYEQILKDLPSPSELTSRQQNLTSKILDRSGTPLYEIYEDENRILVPLSQIPQDLIHATIAIEDQHFYEHHGLDLQGIIRAIRTNSEGKKVHGGSTITQQLVKLRLLSPEKKLKRKIKEGVLAVLVENQYSKNQILEMYFNHIGYGGAIYGVEAASQRYFGKNAKDLTLAESAFLAGLPASPSNYNPFGNTPELAQARQAEVLRRMVEDEYITAEQAAIAQTEKLAFQPETTNIEAPHFVMYVKQLLAEKYGEEMVNKGGLEVTTTLDLPLHQATQAQVTAEITKLTRLKITNGAAMITNPQTGEVLSMVGSTDYFDITHDGQVNVALRERQPGSSIKPLTYALALEKGYTPASLLDDTPVQFVIPGSAPYAPQNYDGKFHGAVPFRQALASSYNIPAVRLLNKLGVNTLIDKAQALGFTTWNDRKRYGLSLTLGAGEVTMAEMTLLYGTLANQGTTIPLNPILEIKNAHGEVLYQNTCALKQTGCEGKQNLDARIAYQITNILSDNQARSSAFGLHSVLHIPKQEVATKTGTTNSMKDNWTFGYTTNRVVAVWVGNNDNTPMSHVASGVTGASPIWNNIMRLTLSDEAPHRFAQPPGLVKVAMCGKYAQGSCGKCSNPREEYFVSGTEPKDSCYASRFTPGKVAEQKTPNPRGSQPLVAENTRDQILEGAWTEARSTSTDTEDFWF